MITYNRQLISDILSNHSGKIIEFKNGDFGDVENFERATYTATEMKFIDCKFHSRLIISEKFLQNGITFFNCEFLDGLSLNNISSSEDRPECAIKIIGSKSFGDVIISECKVEYIDIQLKVNTAALRCINSEAKTELRLIEIQAQRLVITKVKSVAININQLECKSTFLYNNAYTHLHIEDSNLRFLKSSRFNSASQLAQYTISFRDCILYNFNLPLIPENEKVTLSFEYNTFKKECSILTPDLIPASRNGINKEPTYILYLNYNNSEHPIAIGNLNEQIQNFIFIKSRRNNVCSYEISNLSVEKLSLNGDSTNTHITLDRINIKTQMEFSKFTGGEGSKFSNLIPCSSKTDLLFQNSTFIKSAFSDFNFNKFKVIKIRSSQFRAAIFDNVTWFDINDIKFLNSSDELSVVRERRILYRQLKQSCEKNDDKQDALKFHSLEEKYHLQELRKSKGNDWVEKVRLYLKSTNSFGHSWLKPIGCLLMLALFSAILLLGFSAPNFSTFWTNLRKTLLIAVQLINPTHSLNEIITSSQNAVKLSAYIYMIDIINRILTTFLVFQTITAFRRQHT